MKISHLVILKKQYLEAILSGRKEVESRFSKARKVPFGQVKSGDVLFLKQSCGPIRAIATVTKVDSFEYLCKYQIERLKEQYNKLICGDEEYWQSKVDCIFGTLIRLEDIREIEPILIKKNDCRSWVILTEQENFGLK